MGRRSAPNDADQQRVESRAEKLLPEEREAGSDDPVRQAATILDESDERTDGRLADLRDAERRRSQETVEPADVDAP